MAANTDSAWYCIRSATRQERRAQASLNELGFSTYLPCLTKWRRTAREKERVTAPLFVGYLFAELTEADIWKALEAFGVHNILRTRGAEPRPVEIAPALVERIRQAEQRGEFDKTRRTRPDPEKGAKIEIIGGQFQGFPAEFVGRREDERIDLLFKMLGRWTPLVLDADKLDCFAEDEAA